MLLIYFITFFILLSLVTCRVATSRCSDVTTQSPESNDFYKVINSGLPWFPLWLLRVWSMGRLHFTWLPVAIRV